MKSFKTLYRTHKNWQLAIMIMLHIVAFAVIVILLYNNVLTRADRGLRFAIFTICCAITVINIAALMFSYVSNLKLAKSSIEKISELEKTNASESEKIKDYIEQLRQEINQNELLRHEIADKNELITTYETILTSNNNKIQSLSSKISEGLDIIEAAREHAEEYDKLKASFLANISHELRTPINGINGFASLLCKNLPPDKRQEYTSQMVSSTNNFVDVLNEVLHYSHIQSGDMDFRPITFDFNKLLRIIKSKTLTVMAQLKKEVMLNFPQNLTEEVFVTLPEKGVTLIIDNLMKNAIKYTNKGSITFSYTLNDNKLEFFVSDTGIGIPQDKQQLIFQSFVQNENILSRRFGGLGLGLSICKAAVSIMGGAITLDSQPSQGSKFSVILPLQNNIADEIELYDKIDKHLKIKLSEKKVLILENNLNDYNFLKTFFDDWQISQISCISGEDEVAVAQRNSEDIGLVVMNLQVPLDHSVRLAQKILNLCPTATFIFTTSQTPLPETLEKISAISTELIYKPLDTNNFTNAINRFLVTQNI